MLEQTIRLVEFETANESVIIRFGPVGNTSHRKAVRNEIGAILDGEDRLSKYEDTYCDLTTMNSQGWKLESFATIYDDSMLKMQVAIFSREIPAE